MTLSTDGLPRWFTQAPAILGVYIRNYKNLQDVWLRWDQRMVLLGANGVGKTNMLECCALLMGTPETKRLVSRRVPDDLAFDISVVLTGDRLVVPLEDVRAIEEYQARWPGANDDSEWLLAVGAREGEALADSVGFAAQAYGASANQLDALRSAMDEGIVRWRLTSSGTERTWSRTLVTRGSLEKLPAATSKEVAWPLRPLSKDWSKGFPKGHDPFTDLMILPSRSDVPVDLQWLPYSRSDLEIAEDLTNAVYEAGRSLGVYQIGSGFEATLLGLMCDLTDGDEGEVDSTQWVVEIAEEIAREQLAQTMPGLPPIELARTNAGLDHDTVVAPFVSGEFEWPAEGFEDGPNTRRPDRAECLVAVSVGGSTRIGRIDEASLASESSLVDALSAGQRRWFDEALQAAATVIRERGRLAAIDAERLVALWQGPDGVRMDPEKLSRALEHAWALDARWTTRAITALLRELAEPMQSIPHSMVLAQALVNLRSIDRGGRGRKRREARTMMLAVIWNELAKAPAARAKVRVFDEPEAHLHSGAVGKVAEALHNLAGGADVLVSSHHPRFVYSSGWAPYHLRLNPHGRTVLGTVTGNARDARTRVARDLGMSRAETLAGARALLLVEGDHETRILEAPPFCRQLGDAGAIVVPLRGAYELRSAALVEVLAELAPEVIGVMIDNGTVSPGERASSELNTLRGFQSLCEEKGLCVSPVLLSGPDIVTYLNQDAVARRSRLAELNWRKIIEEYRSSGRSGFKDWLVEVHDIDLRHGHLIDAVLQDMLQRRLPFEPGLVRAINTFTAQLMG